MNENETVFGLTGEEETRDEKENDEREREDEEKRKFFSFSFFKREPPSQVCVCSFA